MKTTSHPVATLLSAMPLNLTEASTLQGTILSIVRDGAPKADPCVLLMQDAEGVKFEAWLANSSPAVEQARTVAVGDSIRVRGFRGNPIHSHRSHGGLHIPLDSIDFLTVMSLPH